MIVCWSYYIVVDGRICFVKMCDADLGLTIAVYVLSSIILILSIIVGLLIYKLKHNAYNVMENSVSMNTEKTANETIRREYSPQISQESQAPLEMNFDTLKKKTEEAKTLLIIDEKENTPKINTPVKSPPFTTAQLNITQELKSHLMKARQVKLERDEIHKICENELTKSQTPLYNNSMQDLKGRASLKKSDTEKSASMPQLLEIDDHYDELPSSRPVDPTIPIVEEVYDLLPPTKNIVVNDEDTDYLVLMRDEREVEPSYINAKIAM